MEASSALDCSLEDNLAGFRLSLGKTLPENNCNYKMQNLVQLFRKFIANNMTSHTKHKLIKMFEGCAICTSTNFGNKL